MIFDQSPVKFYVIFQIFLSVTYTNGYNCETHTYFPGFRGLTEPPINYEENLKCYLFSKLNQHTRPTWADTNATKITIRSWYVNLDTLNGIFELRGLINMEWLDQRLTWKPNKYNGQYSLNITDDLIWIPKIQLINNPAFAYEEFLGAGNTTALNHGVISHSAPFNIRTRCKIGADESRFLNTHNCQLNFRMNVIHSDFTFSKRTYSDITSPWTITNTQYTYLEENDETESVSVNVTLKRDILSTCVKFARNNTVEQLRCHLLTNYNSSHAPIHGYLDLSEFTIHYADVHASGMFQLFGDLEVKWEDPQLTWEPSKYDNINSLDIKNDTRRIWKPAFASMNDVFPNKKPLLSSGHFTTVSNYGLVTLVARAINILATCDIKTKNLPWVNQKCYLEYKTDLFNKLTPPIFQYGHKSSDMESPWTVENRDSWREYEFENNNSYAVGEPVVFSRKMSQYQSTRCILFANTYEEQLKCNLLSNVNSSRPPQQAFLLGPRVDMMVSYANLNIEKGIFLMKAILVMNWTDERMAWNPEKFGNQSVLNVEEEAVWKPCFVLNRKWFQDSLSNSSHDEGHFVILSGPREHENWTWTSQEKLDTRCNTGGGYLKAFSNGNMSWAPPMDLFARCYMASNSWPWNPQTCQFNFTFNTVNLNLNLSRTMLPGALWTVTNIARKLPCHSVFKCAFEITLEKKSDPLQIVLRLLFTGVSLVTLLSFLISPMNRIKLASKISSLMLLVIFLVMLMNSIPHFITYARNFLIGYVVLLLMVGISSGATAYYVRLARKSISYNALLNMKFSCPKENEYENDTMKTELIEAIMPADVESSNKSQNEWLKVAMIIEYSSFTICLIIVVLLTISLMN
ncbi:uncharacterized protein LOC135847704 [Planococcus citri]|uniref:uncharacterized protein LOC135847704 n=1 Tax=Planococcus citri TaxID=170843 RepID=UPI0031F8A90E